MSVIHLSLADATAISFSRPLFATIFAIFLLKELVSKRRWSATIVGFGGVIIMVRPGLDGSDPVALIAVGAALTFSIANVMIRMMSTTEPPNRILFYYHLGGTIIFAIPTAMFWTQPVGIEWLLLVAIGVLTTIGMIGFVRAFSEGEMNAVGPMEYIRLVYAALLGFFSVRRGARPLDLSGNGFHRRQRPLYRPRRGEVAAVADWGVLLTPQPEMPI